MAWAVVRGASALVAAALALAACVGGPPPEAPPLGAPRGAAPVPGLTVGHRLMAASQPELALRAFNRAAAEEGLSAEVLTALGSANLALGRLGQAEARLRQAVARDESSVIAWNNLGAALMERGRPAEAAESFRRAYALDDGESDQVRDNLRLALARMPDLENGGPEDDGTPALTALGGGVFALRAGAAAEEPFP